MRLRGIEFKNVFAASGSLNFFGEGWWYHFWNKLLFPGFKKISDATFVSKTTTWHPRAGNMPLKENLQPKSLLPDCIKLYPFKGIVLNAVGLSGPGAKKLFASNRWQNIKKPFFISFMSVEKTAEERELELKNFITLFKKELPKFRTQVGIQLNLSCPNTEHQLDELETETVSALHKLSVLNVPIDLKVNIFFSNKILKLVSDERLCDVITVSNTIPFGSRLIGLNWFEIFSSDASPLQKYGGGGLSGKTILPYVLERISGLRAIGVDIPIKGSGGIMQPDDVNRMKHAGADAIEFATAAMLRPWRVKKIVKRAEEIFQQKNKRK
jgi:dihydroorotate dehydrogenase